jgi:plastocyanin
MIDSDFNDANSPIYQDPYIAYGTDGNNYEWKLRLALNTDQYSRTFEDRSHTFIISKRPSGITDSHRIINLNVRGKRGNIVEAYPAVEYDFTPAELIVNKGDYVHFQWTGCDTNPNYAGEGTQRTDRSNIAQIHDRKKNIPMSFSEQTMFEDSGTAFRFAHLGQYGGKVCTTTDETGCCKTLEQLKAAGGDINQNEQNCMKLNAPEVQYFNGGTVQMKKAGVYHYMSTRNNNFTNRSQKGSITVDPLLPTWGVALAGIGAAGFIGASAVAGGYYYATTHPASAIANFFAGVSV